MILPPTPLLSLTPRPIASPTPPAGPGTILHCLSAAGGRAPPISLATRRTLSPPPIYRASHNQRWKGTSAPSGRSSHRLENVLSSSVHVPTITRATVFAASYTRCARRRRRGHPP